MSKSDKRAIIRTLRTAADLGLSLIYPPRCPLCETVLPIARRIRPEGQERSCWERPLICDDCREKLPYNSGAVCLRCGTCIADEREEYCGDCLLRERLFRQGMSVFLYQGKMRDSLMRMKFHNHREYIPFYADEMKRASEAFLRRAQPSVIIPVPMHERKRRERGFDQCALLARRFSECSGIPVQTDNVVRVRYTKPQKGLNAQERRNNLKNAFYVRRPQELSGPVLVIDDIYTTGTTMDAMASVLLENGCGPVFFLTLCCARIMQ